MKNFEIMNRETKFRVWDIAKQKYLPTDCYALVITDFGAFGVMINNHEDYMTGEYLYPNAQVLEFFTGLKDKNGVDIYEGDILQLDNDSNLWTIKYFGCGFRGEPSNKNNLAKGYFLTNNNYLQFQVIGNLHQNPELLTN